MTMRVSPKWNTQKLPEQESESLHADLQNTRWYLNGQLQSCFKHAFGDEVNSDARNGRTAEIEKEREEAHMEIESVDEGVQQAFEDVSMAEGADSEDALMMKSAESSGEVKEGVSEDPSMGNAMVSLTDRPVALMKRLAAADEVVETNEQEAKRRCLSIGVPADIIKVHVVDLGGKEFHVDITKGERIADVKQKILKEQGYQLNLSEIKLILGAEVLDDMVDLSGTSVKDGNQLTLIKHVGVMQLVLEQIFDDTQWHGRHKFALRSAPLTQEVEKIEVTVRDFQDQGWGGCQARLFIYLYDAANTQVAAMKIFGPLRTAEYDERKHRRSPSCTIGEAEAVVALARPGMVYKLKYQCGGGGGHSITVKDWCCNIYPKARSSDDVTIQVKGAVNLHNTSRLGPDKATGKWELQEPPYL